FHWANPFYHDEDPIYGHFPLTCEAVGTFHGTQYKFSDFDVNFPEGLAPWKQAMQPFFARDYPGNWRGVDPGRKNREYVMMEYSDVPAPVRDWIEEQHRVPNNNRIWLMGIFGKPKRPDNSDDISPPVVGRITPDMFNQTPANDMLDKYSPHLKDDAVVAWPIDISEPDEEHGKAITFTIKAQHRRETGGHMSFRSQWEKLQRSVHRQARKEDRKQKAEKRRKMESGILDDD
ncbi:hypothetical protein GQ53DRAFT_610467, partial [Thozetella sp. PMI_491]